MCQQKKSDQIIANSCSKLQEMPSEAIKVIAAFIRRGDTQGEKAKKLLKNMVDACFSVENGAKPGKWALSVLLPGGGERAFTKFSEVKNHLLSC